MRAIAGLVAGLFAGLFAALLPAKRAVAHAASECAYDPPTPLLQAHAYPGQTQVRQGGNRLREAAQLRPGLDLEIRHSGCVDAVVLEYVLTLTGNAQGDDALIDLARSTIAGLKTHAPAGSQNDLLAFLARAHGLRPQDAIRAQCKDGSTPGDGSCSWDSGGGYSVVVKRTGKSTRVVVTEYFST